MFHVDSSYTRSNQVPIWLLILAIAALPACVRVPKRNPLPASLAATAMVPGMDERVRFWGDEAPPHLERWFRATPEQLQEEHKGIMGKPHTYLAISGGGENGAFGAGLLNGWSEAGTRPEFTIVTGISTGALTAPFAFLGSDYDDELEEVYTQYSSDEILKRRGTLKMITSDAAASSKPLQALLRRYIDEEMRQAIAREHRMGRRLYIGTTNLDAGRPVVWNLGLIAISPHTGALDLMRSILLASSSVPGGFPPVLVKVEAGGGLYDEMHVDGGTTSQVFLYPVGIDWSRVLKNLQVPGRPDVYVLRNGRLDATWKTTKNKFTSIAGRAVSALIRTQGEGDLYRIYLQTVKDGLNFHFASIPASFTQQPKEPFDQMYMQALFVVGHDLGLRELGWKGVPPIIEINADENGTLVPVAP